MVLLGVGVIVVEGCTVRVTVGVGVELGVGDGVGGDDLVGVTVIVIEGVIDGD